MKKTFIAACVLGVLTMTSCEEKKQVKESINTSLASVSTPKEVAITAEEFTQKAYIGNMAEVQLGEMAKKKATNKEVKQFGEMAIKEHKKANDKLKSLAEEKNIMLSETMPSDIKKKMDDLKNKSAKEFDKAYMDYMEKEHKKDVKLYEQAMDDIQDTELSQYISETLPVLKNHLEKAQQINQRLEQTARAK